MTSWLWRFGTMSVFFGFAFILPATVGAQPPVYLTQWGSQGSGNGRFDRPSGVATAAAGDLYVADDENHRIQKFGDTLTPTKATTWGRIKSLYR